MLNRPISKAAERVLSYLDELLAEPAHYRVELYVNGRERGYAVRCYENSRKVAFAEYRNSDGIVVYFGVDDLGPNAEEERDFAWDTNVPSEAVYERKVFFDYGQAGQTALAVQKYLEGEDEPSAN